MFACPKMTKYIHSRKFGQINNEVAIDPAGSSRTQSDRRRLGSVTLARSRVRVRAGYEFVSCRRHGDQRLPAGPIVSNKHPPNCGRAMPSGDQTYLRTECERGTAGDETN